MKDSLKMHVSKLCLPVMLLGALLTGFTLVFPVLGFLEWFTMIPIFLGVFSLAERENVKLRRYYLFGFLTVFVYYVVNYHWFCALYPLDFAGLDPLAALVVIAAGWFGLSLLQALPGGLVFLFWGWMQKKGVFDRYAILRPITLGALWVIFEWSSTLHWTGVPWGRLCLGQSEYLPVLQTASLFGSYLISFLILLVNGLLAYALFYLSANRKKAIVCSVTAVSLALANLILGVGLYFLKTPSEERVRVAVIQGNMSSHEKWGGDSERITKQIYGEKTRLAAEEGAEVVLWPETAFPNKLNASYNRDLAAFVSSLARECRVTLIIGALYEDEEGNTYNALYYVDPDGRISKDVYAKRHLVPFGEYVPMRDLIMTLIPPLSEISMLKTDLCEGTDSALFDTPYGKMGSLICFDSIYEQLTLDSVRDGAELMLLSSNDSWFFDSAAIYQHEAQARLRAIENGRYLARSGNTGISSVVTEKGDRLVYIEPLIDGYGVADVEMKSNRTLYSCIGNVLVYACIAFCLALPVFKRITASKSKK